jgi:hypothetical protein
MKTQDLKAGFIIFGNKGAVWSNECHIIGEGFGTLCGNPALSTNWAFIEEVEHIGCQKCIEVYKQAEQPKTAYEKWSEGKLCNFGSFHTSLLETYQKADSNNRIKLETAFPEWFVDKK